MEKVESLSKTSVQVIEELCKKTDEIYNMLGDTIRLPLPKPYVGWHWVQYSDCPLPHAAFMSLRIEITWRTEYCYIMVKEWTGSPLWHKRFALLWEGTDVPEH